MRKILVPYDGSPSATHALQHAIGMARGGDVHIELLNVQTPLPLGSLALSPDEIRQVQAGEAGKVLAPARAILDACGVPYLAQSRVGSPPSEIARHCEEHACEAVVMGTRGLGPLSSVMAGSVATRVIHLVDVPVTLVK